MFQCKTEIIKPSSRIFFLNPMQFWMFTNANISIFLFLTFLAFAGLRLKGNKPLMQWTKNIAYLVNFSCTAGKTLVLGIGQKCLNLSISTFQIFFSLRIINGRQPFKIHCIDQHKHDLKKLFLAWVNWCFFLGYRYKKSTLWDTLPKPECNASLFDPGHMAIIW